MDKRCSTCAMYISNEGVCARTRAYEVPTNLCSHWCEEVPVCDICHSLFVPPITWIYDKQERPHRMCPNCFNARNTCKLCIYNNGCAFKESPINIPPVINQTVRQGNMVMTTQVPNPARIDATCKSGCHCHSEDGCNREFGTCANFTFVLDIERED